MYFHEEDQLSKIKNCWKQIEDKEKINGRRAENRYFSFARHFDTMFDITVQFCMSYSKTEAIYEVDH